MKEALIVYASRYGSTKKYAECLARTLQIPVASTAEVTKQQLAACQVLIFGGGLYAERINGIAWLQREQKRRPEREYLVFTCGLSDPKDPNTYQKVQSVLAGVLQGQIPLFCLRGSIDYDRLGFKDRAMMSIFCRILRKKSAVEQSEQTRQLLESYGKAVDYTDPAALEPLITEIRARCKIDKSYSDGCFT